MNMVVFALMLTVFVVGVALAVHGMAGREVNFPTTPRRLMGADNDGIVAPTRATSAPPRDRRSR